MIEAFPLFTSILILIVALASCETTKLINAPRYAIYEQEMELREKPDPKARLLDTIPYGEEVNLKEEKTREITIGTKTGKWSRIEWKSLTGWVFGGFLIADKPDDQAKYANLQTRIRNAKPGETIKVSTGKYNVDASHGLLLAGLNDITLKALDAGAELISFSPDATIVTIKDCNNLTFDGFTVYHTAATECSASCIDIGGCHSVAIQYCDIQYVLFA